jgi:hypothetical protein
MCHVKTAQAEAVVKPRADLGAEVLLGKMLRQLMGCRRFGVVELFKDPIVLWVMLQTVHGNVGYLLYVTVSGRLIKSIEKDGEAAPHTT